MQRLVPGLQAGTRPWRRAASGVKQPCAFWVQPRYGLHWNLPRFGSLGVQPRCGLHWNLPRFDAFWVQLRCAGSIARQHALGVADHADKISAVTFQVAALCSPG
jgi:hypothetical protein